jgi:rhodanese-related sulfurtransferase
VAGFLMRNGFTRVLNLTGGIDAWARDLDPNVPSY